MQGDRDHASLMLVHQVMEIFQLLPKSPMHRWLIAADWLEEAGAEVTAAAIREGIWVLDPYRYGFQSGRGEAYGYGVGHREAIQSGGGDGFGQGYGHGYGYGSGERIRIDRGIIYECGEGEGNGDGRGCGDGDGKGYSYGYDSFWDGSGFV